MTRGRLEAFSDGVVAILITIMVLELRPPAGASFADLAPLVPRLLSYVLSFVYVGIYWNNHHHLMHAVQRVNGRVLWANLHLLFWLSLTPFATAWMGERGAAPATVAAYAAVQLLAAIAYELLTRALLAIHASGSTLAVAIGADRKGKVSLAAYAAAVPLAFMSRWVALALLVAVAVLWCVPDRRIERILERERA
jgi:TMEM175 potassium channel family protein